MDNKQFKPEVILENLGPEVKSFIYQAILEFEPFTTPETIVTVVAKNPLELLKNDVGDRDEESTVLSINETLPNKNKLKKMFRIAISLKEGDTVINSEALHENIYDAIRIAKDKLVKTLTEIQDDIISNQDRHIQIRHALAAGETIH